MAFLDALTDGAAINIHCDDEHSGALLDLAALVARARRVSHFYCCGPTPMLDAFRTVTAAVPGRVHVEYFSAKEEASKDGGFTVTLARSGREVVIAAGKSILETLREGAWRSTHRARRVSAAFARRR